MGIKMDELITFLSALDKVDQEHKLMKKLLSEIANKDNAREYRSAIEAEQHFDCVEWMERVRGIL